jgi:hypothetical protein
MYMIYFFNVRSFDFFKWIESHFNEDSFEKQIQSHDL